MSWHQIHRVSISSQVAQTLYEQYPASRGKLALILDDKIITDATVLLQITRITLMAWWQQRSLLILVSLSLWLIFIWAIQ